VCPAALLEIFLVKWRKTTRGEWADGEACGGALLAKINAFSRDKLGDAVPRILAGTSKEWDVTILTSLLCFQPGYCKGKPLVLDALNSIRKARGGIAHLVEAKQQMADADFKAKWDTVVGSLGAIMSTFFPKGASQVEQMRGSIAKVLEKQGDARPVRLDNGRVYTLLRRAGEGSFGTVFVAYDRVKDRNVAFKICEDQEGTDRGDREARILQKLFKLKHPNIAAFLSSSKFQGKRVIVMDLVKGDSLDKTLAKEGAAFGVERAKNMMLQLTSGMGAVHSLNIAHRDLKPENIMYDEVSGHAVIVDFGISKEQNVNSTVTNTSGAKIGTVLYMSPEQTEGVVSEIGPRADVWALGVIFYKILVGLHPFLPPCSASPAAGGGSGKTMMSKKEEAMMIVNICEMECPALPDTPANASVAEVVYRALQKDQRDRYDDAGDMHAHLKGTFASLEAPGDAEGGSARPHDSWTERQLAELLRKLGPKFSGAAATIEEDCVNGKLWNELVKAKAITKSIPDGGLGLTILQLMRVQQELNAL